MAVEGAIADRVRGIIPITWDALTNDARFSDSLLQAAIDTSKVNVTGVVIPSDDEVLYSLKVIDFIAKITVLELITPGIDFWMNEELSESATGTNENHTYVDRAEKLKELREALLAETRAKADDIAEILGQDSLNKRAVPLSSTIDDPFLTPSHQEFPRPYSETSFT